MAATDVPYGPGEGLYPGTLVSVLLVRMQRFTWLYFPEILVDCKVSVYYRQSAPALREEKKHTSLPF